MADASEEEDSYVSEQWMEKRRSPAEIWSSALEGVTDAFGVEFTDDNRWRRALDGSVFSTDRLGDFLITRFGRLVSSSSIEFDLYEVFSHVSSLLQPLLEYENEARELVRLANTSHVLDLVERSHRTLDAYSRTQDVPESESIETEWRSQLHQERQDRLQFYQALLGDRCALESQVQREIDHDKDNGEFQYCLELLTLLKHDYLAHSAKLLPSERDVLLAAYTMRPPSRTLL